MSNRDHMGYGSFEKIKNTKFQFNKSNIMPVRQKNHRDMGLNSTKLMCVLAVQCNTDISFKILHLDKHFPSVTLHQLCFLIYSHKLSVPKAVKRPENDKDMLYS